MKNQNQLGFGSGMLSKSFWMSQFRNVKSFSRKNKKAIDGESDSEQTANPESALFYHFFDVMKERIQNASKSLFGFHYREISWGILLLKFFTALLIFGQVSYIMTIRHNNFCPMLITPNTLTFMASIGLVIYFSLRARQFREWRATFFMDVSFFNGFAVGAIINLLNPSCDVVSGLLYATTMLYALSILAFFWKSGRKRPDYRDLNAIYDS